jgi:hypothetical protein
LPVPPVVSVSSRTSGLRSRSWITESRAAADERRARCRSESGRSRTERTVWRRRAGRGTFWPRPQSRWPDGSRWGSPPRRWSDRYSRLRACRPARARCALGADVGDAISSHASCTGKRA